MPSQNSPKITKHHRNIYLIRHAETEWSLSGQHTGTTDIPLTKKGEQDALKIKEKLKGHPFELILCSPRIRAKTTCEIAGLMHHAKIDPDLAEWDYGAYEGLTTAEIHQKSPQWNIFKDGAPGGESLADIAMRTSKILSKIELIQGDVALFSHGHFLRALAATWMELSVQQGRRLDLSPCSISILGFEREAAVLSLWNSVTC